MNEQCSKCKYYRKLKHNFKRGTGFEESHACVVFADEGEVMEVEPNSMCEMFTEGSD